MNCFILSSACNSVTCNPIKNFSLEQCSHIHVGCNVAVILFDNSQLEICVNICYKHIYNFYKYIYIICLPISMIWCNYLAVSIMFCCFNNSH